VMGHGGFFFYFLITSQLGRMSARQGHTCPSSALGGTRGEATRGVVAAWCWRGEKMEGAAEKKNETTAAARVR
jgi:hypothetical protein